MMKAVMGVVVTACWLPVAFSATPAAVTVKADPARGAQIAAAVCAACHGADGNSAVGINPNLAAQPEQYIAAQLALFKSGKEDQGKQRVNAIMAGMAAALTPEDMRALGAHYARQKPGEQVAARDAKLAGSGKLLYRAGNKDTGVPACAGCHGPNGSGIPALYPRLAGQWPEYTLSTLKAYASGERKHPIMSAIAQRMTEKDMKAAAEYTAGLR